MVSPSPESKRSQTEYTDSRVAPRVRHKLRHFGPVMIVSALTVGPGSTVTGVTAGADMGYGVLWLVVFIALFSFVFIDMGVRIGMAFPGSPAAAVQSVIGRPMRPVIGVAYLVLSTLFMTGSILGAVIGLVILFGGSVTPWTCVLTAVALVVLWRRNLYRTLEIVMMLLIAVMVIAFGATAFMSGPRWGAVASGFVPSMSVIRDHGLALVALLAANTEIYTALYSAYVTREKGTPIEDYRATTLSDTITGSLAPKVILALTAIAAATVLAGAPVSDVGTIANALGPVLGPAAPVIFAIGILAAGFSSVMGNASAGGIVFADSIGLGLNLRSSRVKSVGTLILIIGAAIIIVVGGQPVSLLILMNAVTALVLPVLAATILVVGNSRRMQRLRNKVWQNVLGVVALLAVLGGSVLLVRDLFAGS